MKRLIAITLFVVTACVVDTSTSDSELVVPPHTGPGVVTCGRMNNPTLTCQTPAQSCRYAPTYADAAACVPPVESDTWFSWASVDGPEDCPVGQHACYHGTYYSWGWRYRTNCQIAECTLPGGDWTVDGTLCNNELTATGCPTGVACVRAGAPHGPFDVNHSGLERFAWLCR